MAEPKTYTRKPETITVVKMPGSDASTLHVLSIDGKDPGDDRLTITAEQLGRDYSEKVKTTRKRKALGITTEGVFGKNAAESIENACAEVEAKADNRKEESKPKKK